jgi:hypothetical protein
MQWRAGRCRNPQINSPFCKPICKPDAAGQLETRETEPAQRDGICPVRRGHHTCERQRGTPETHVVWLITQGSPGSNPAPAAKARGPFSNRERAFCMRFVRGFAHGRPTVERVIRMDFALVGSHAAGRQCYSGPVVAHALSSI